jgi:hypothetical protein
MMRRSPFRPSAKLIGAEWKDAKLLLLIDNNNYKEGKANYSNF